MSGSPSSAKVAVVPYELSLEPDPDRGGHVYSAVVSGELEPPAVRELSDWVGDAKQNPDASFVIDLSGTTRTTPRARLELRTLLRRHEDLRAARRLTVLERSRSRRRALASGLGPVVAGGFLERALSGAASTPFPL
jgi:hypothetical protein